MSSAKPGSMLFNLTTARQYAAEGRLETWIHAYLLSGDWANPGLSDGLKLQRRWWIGPVELPLAVLTRCCGPEPEMEFRMSPAAWDRRVNGLADSLVALADVPPLIVQYRAGVYSIRDGNHRHEALRRKGWRTCWAVIWYDDAVTWQASPYHP